MTHPYPLLQRLWVVKYLRLMRVVLGMIWASVVVKELAFRRALFVIAALTLGSLALL